MTKGRSGRNEADSWERAGFNPTSSSEPRRSAIVAWPSRSNCSRTDAFSRVVDQLAGAGSSVGANIAEADEAMSRKDFRKCLAIAIKELAETRYWLRICVRRNWLPAARLDPLLQELVELKKFIGTILKRTESPV